MSAWESPDRGVVALIPKTGMIIPEMGRPRARAEGGGLAGALFTPVQQRVLGLLFTQPARRFQSAELIRLAGSGTGAAHRQLQRLASTGLVLATRDGHQKYYQANRGSPIFSELHGLIVKTVGVVEPLRSALAPLGDKIRGAFVFGSLAKGSEDAQSDLDLLVIGDALDYSSVYEALQGAESQLNRPVNPTLMSPSEWKKKRARRDSFAARIASQPRLFVIGSEDVVG
jgi:predicted nucleotidyltransferase